MFWRWAFFQSRPLRVCSVQMISKPVLSQMGQRGLVVPELDEINEARLAMPFGVPLSIIGARLGMASSSYGNRKSDREGFWDETLSPLYKELAGPLCPCDGLRVVLGLDHRSVARGDEPLSEAEHALAVALLLWLAGDDAGP